MSVFVITGSSRGLGLELVRQLAARGNTVYALVRTANDNLREISGDVKVVEGVDVTAANVADVLAKALAGVKVDCLINNAGSYGSTAANGVMEMFAAQSLDKVSPADMRAAFELNTVAPLVVTRAVLPCMAEGGKVIIITSLMGSIEDNTSGGSYAYRVSKAAVNMLGKSLAMDLKGKGIAVGLVHPGAVKTEFGGDTSKMPEAVVNSMHDVQSSVKGVIEAIDATSLATTGHFTHGNYGEGIKPCPW